MLEVRRGPIIDPNATSACMVRAAGSASVCGSTRRTSSPTGPMNASLASGAGHWGLPPRGARFRAPLSFSSSAMSRVKLSVSDVLNGYLPFVAAAHDLRWSSRRPEIHLDLTAVRTSSCS